MALKFNLNDEAQIKSSDIIIKLLLHISLRPHPESVSKTFFSNQGLQPRLTLNSMILVPQDLECRDYRHALPKVGFKLY